MAFRKLVGCVAIALPFAVWAGGAYFEKIPIQDSVSSYYYTFMRDLFVGQRFPAFNDTVCYVNRRPLKFHDTVSTIFFGLISNMMIFMFPLTKETFITPQKQWRNLVYLGCGVAMVVCVVLIAIRVTRGVSIFWPETITIGTLGAAWLTKGEVVLRDDESQRTIPVAGRYRWGWGKGSPRRGSLEGV